MGVAFYIVLDNEEPGFDTSVDGKAIAREAKKLDAISKKLGLPRFDDFISMSSEDIADLIGDDVEIPEQEEQWFSAAEGLSFIEALVSHMRANPKSVKTPAGVLDDLTAYREVLEKAKAIGAK
ncbi:MAG: hypothetical protein EXR78_04515 [Deltaproteobacteria bacterium]|nr:hypothetical protein [Deltaproteobacteria bacterium]